MTASLTVGMADAGLRRSLDLLVLERMRIAPWDRVLFVECGDGWIVEEAWRRAQRAYVCGLDTCATHVELARRWREVPGRLEFQSWDGQHLPPSGPYFDRVAATFPLMPAPDPRPLCRDMRRVLVAEGDLYLLHPVSAEAQWHAALVEAGLVAVGELARSDDQASVLLHARAAESAPRVGHPERAVA